MMLAEEQISRLSYGGCKKAVSMVYSPNDHDALDWCRSMVVHSTTGYLPCRIMYCQGPDYQ